MLKDLRIQSRRLARSMAVGGLSRMHGVRGLTDEALARPMIHFPYLHAVPQAEYSDFVSLLECITRTHTLISYTEAVNRVLHGPIDKPYAAISFDDGFKSNLSAARALEEFGTTGMFFVPTNAVGIPTVTQARSFFKFVDGCDEPIMDWSDLEHLRSRGHEVGNHTVSHSTLSKISLNEATEEIGIAASVLRERLGVCDHFAWPNGRFIHFKGDLIEAVFNTGHKSCASAERGAHSAVHQGTASSLCLRRDHVMTSWSLEHNRYFIGRAAAGSSIESNRFPENYR